MQVFSISSEPCEPIEYTRVLWEVFLVIVVITVLFSVFDGIVKYSYLVSEEDLDAAIVELRQLCVVEVYLLVLKVVAKTVAVALAGYNLALFLAVAALGALSFV